MNSFENLKQWIIQNGGFVHPAIGIDETNHENRILIAKEKIEKNELILQVPKNLSLGDNKDISVNEIFAIASKDILKILTLHKEFELGEKSFYYPYLSMLQDLKSYQSHPYYQLHYDREKSKDWQKICNFSKLVDIRLLKQKMIEKFFEKVHKIPLEKEQILYYELLIMTRAWDRIGFVPFADLFQSTQNSNMFLGDNDEKTHYQLIVDRTYEPNQTIWINYGIYDESLLYCNFGFIDDMEEERNISRTLRISLPVFNNLDDSEELKKFKEEKISTFNKNELFFSYLGISNSLMAHLRCFNLSEKDYLFMDKNQDFKTIISIENESFVIKNIINFLFSGFFPSKEMVEESKKIIDNIENKESKYTKQSVEYHFAKITMYQKKIFQFVFQMIMKGILEIYNLPSYLEVLFHNHYLLD